MQSTRSKNSRDKKGNSTKVAKTKVKTPAQKKVSKQDKSTSLVSPSGMGGITGGKGYDFQSRYITCLIPKLLLASSFKEVFHEGTGDVDIRYGSRNKQHREHIQIKDHPVSTKTELKAVIQTFASFDQGMPGVYQKFTLACPSLSSTINPLATALDRLRNAKPFYESVPASLSNTLTDVNKRMANLGLTVFQDFIKEKVYFEVGLPNCHDDKDACDKFAMNLLEHPEYREKFVHLIKPAYTSLFHEVINHRGKVIDRQKLKNLIDKAIKDGGSIVEGIDLDIHNWTLEKYDREPTYVIDWTKYFDRDTRTVPSEKVWNKKLVPELYELRKKIARETTTRFIRLRGKNSLTTGIALGAAFPQIGGWMFEIPQPPQVSPWRSDAVPDSNYNLSLGKEVKISPKGNSIGIVFNIKGSATNEVKAYILHNSIPVKIIISFEPEGASGSLSISDDREAISLAMKARDIIKESLIRYNVNHTHLFYYGPFALAVFMGQLLTSVGQLQLYEYISSSYSPSSLLQT